MSDSYIKMFRLNGYDNTSEGTLQFYLKVYHIDDDDDEKDTILCNLCIDESGCSYYRPGSHILTEKENINTQNSMDGFLSMEKLKELFEAIKSADLYDKDMDDSNFKFEVKDGKVVIGK